MSDVRAREADVREEPVVYRCGEVELRGYLAVPAEVDAPVPGVLVFPEWWGVTDFPRERARQLAAQGYVALAADMYGDGLATDDYEQAAELASDTRLGPLARARAAAAFEVLGEHPHVDAARIAAIGFCFGGDVALELARSGADVRGVVAFHAALPTLEPAQAETMQARVLALHGADDPLVPPDRLAAFQDEMRGARADWQLVSYGNAVHSFTNPTAGEHGIEGVAYDETAARRAWALHLAFLAEVLATDGH